jgi:murein DD-endopeptidase MepM/ murein hydrolase activator NlpD
MNARMLRALMIGASALALAGCENGFDFDLRGSTGAFGTADAVRGEAPSRPEPDPRGVISYPAYQVAVAQPGDTVSTLAGRVGLPADEVARFNGLTPDMALREGEVVALPRRVSEPAGGFAGGGSGTDVASIAGAAIDRASGGGPGVATPPGTLDAPRGSSEPTRHQVVRGETAYTIARLYGVSVRALADWNGLGPDLAVREGSYLMIPPAAPASSGVETTTLPGEGTATPLPPSAETPLPEEDETPEAETETPPSPDLGSERTEAPAQGTLAMPVRGSIIRAYERGKNEGIDISATAGADVTAAAAGTVAAVTQSTENVSIVIIRHDGAAFGSSEPILTVYANLEGITVARGASVSRGQAIGKVRAGNPAFIRFEVRRGFETLDPTEYLR